MNIAIDTGTLFKISSMLFVIMPSITWMMLGRPRRGAALVWCTGGLMVGLSLWLISQRGQVSYFWGYGVAQTLCLGSFLVLAQSLRMDLHCAWPWRWLLWLLLAYGAVIVLGFEDKGSPSLDIMVRVANSLGLTSLTVSAWMLARQERSRNAWFMTLGYGLMTASMYLATVGTLRGLASLHAFNDSVFSQILGGTSLLTMLMSYMGYLGLALERSLRQNMALRQTQWQAQQWRERRQALTLHDRQRTLAVLANSLGHAILQPLTATLLQVQIARRLLLTTTPNASLVQASLSQVLVGLRRSADMVGHIREFLRPTPTPDNGAPLRLQSVVQDAHDLLRQELIYQGVELHVSCPAASVDVQAERLLITQALVQVLRNAMQAAQAVQGQPRRSIDLVLEAQTDEARITVTDSGPGFSKPILSQVHTGSVPPLDTLVGMGLYMTKSILTQFQGQLLLENTPGTGARVRMTLPLANAKPMV